MTRLGIIFGGGLLFGFGLGLSDLTRQEVVLSFLYLEDLGLGLTMAAAIVMSMPAYRILASRLDRPALGGAFERFPGLVARNHILGGVVFGIGWGVSGVCPGAALASLGTGNWPMLAGFGGMLLGAYLQGVVAEPAPRPTT